MFDALSGDFDRQSTMIECVSYLVTQNFSDHVTNTWEEFHRMLGMQLCASDGTSFDSTQKTSKLELEILKLG